MSLNLYEDPSTNIFFKYWRCRKFHFEDRMFRNYLIGTAADKINPLSAVSAYNMMKWMKLIRQVILLFFFGGIA